MIGVCVSVPIACFRKGMAREYLETYDYPPPSTCYGFLLSLVGEVDRNAHIGVRVTFALRHRSERSVILRTKWRIKNAKVHPGVGTNRCPDYQQLLTQCDLVIWLDSSEEPRLTEGLPTLESRVRTALDPSTRGQIERFGGLSLGESTHLVNEVSLFDSEKEPNVSPASRETETERYDAMEDRVPLLFLSEEQGGTEDTIEDRNWPSERITLPVWVDHVGATKTRYVTGVLVPGNLVPANLERIPKIVSA